MNSKLQVERIQPDEQVIRLTELLMEMQKQWMQLMAMLINPIYKMNPDYKEDDPE